MVEAAEVEVRALQKDLDGIWLSITQHFEAMIVTKIESKESSDDRAAREAFQKFLIKGNQMFEAIKMDFEDLKREYGKNLS